MAAGGDAGSSRRLSREQIGAQGRYLLETFVVERLQAEQGASAAPSLTVEQLEAGGDTVAAAPVPNTVLVGRYLRQIGDELDQDENLQILIDRLPVHSTRETFLKIAQEIFADGVFNWGRIVALFYFAYRYIRKIVYELPHVRMVIDWVTTFLVDFAAPWIISRGGWEMISEHFGQVWQPLVTLIAGVLCSMLVVIVKSR